MKKVADITGEVWVHVLERIDTASDLKKQLESVPDDAVLLWTPDLDQQTLIFYKGEDDV